MWILDHKRDTLYRVSDRVFSLSKDEALGTPGRPKVSCEMLAFLSQSEHSTGTVRIVVDAAAVRE